MTIDHDAPPPAVTASPAPAKAEPEPRYRRISSKVMTAINALAEGNVKTIKDAAMLAGLHKESLRRALTKPPVRRVLHERTRQILAQGQLRAGRRLVELIDAESEKTSLDVAARLLAIEGFVPVERGHTQVSVSLDIKAGYVIDLSGKHPSEQAQVIEHDEHEDGGQP